VSNNTLRRVEQACTDLLDAGEQVTFTAVAARTGLARTTLYRNQRLRAVVDEHRARQAEERTLSGLTSEIAHLRTALEAVATTVRRHEEQPRNLERRRTADSLTRRRSATNESTKTSRSMLEQRSGRHSALAMMTPVDFDDRLTQTAQAA
jgi:Family of unknown function (DUF6262)